MTTLPRGAAALTAAVTLSLLLGACAGESTQDRAGGPAASAGTAAVEEAHNEADVAFATGMIPHHRQAVEMSELAADRTDTPEVLELAEEISAAQGPEIETMTGFLETWGEDVPEDMAGMDHGGMSTEEMPGMMSDGDMAALEDAQGVDFDQMFLRSMVAHHEGAVEMAQTQLAEGENPSALELAQEVIDAQRSEISRMQELLGS